MKVACGIILACVLAVLPQTAGADNIHMTLNQQHLMHLMILGKMRLVLGLCIVGWLLQRRKSLEMMISSLTPKGLYYYIVKYWPLKIICNYCFFFFLASKFFQKDYKNRCKKYTMKLKLQKLGIQRWALLIVSLCCSYTPCHRWRIGCTSSSWATWRVTVYLYVSTPCLLLTRALPG